MDWATSKEPQKIYGTKKGFRSFSFRGGFIGRDNSEFDINTDTFALAPSKTKRKGIPVDNGKGLKKRPITPSTENINEFVPILPVNPKTDEEIEHILKAADVKDRAHLLSLLLRNDQAEIMPFLVDYPDGCSSQFHSLLSNLGFQEIALANSTKMKYLYDKSVLKKALLKTTPVSNGEDDILSANKFNLRLDVAMRSNAYSLRSSVRSPRPEESPRDTHRCGSVETVLSDTSPCSTPSSFHSGSRPRSSSTTSNIVRVFQRLRTSTSPADFSCSLGPANSVENREKEAETPFLTERAPSLPDFLCDNSSEAISVIDESPFSRACSMPQFPSAHKTLTGISTADPHKYIVNNDRSSSPIDLPIPDLGVLSSIVMDNYVTDCSVSSPVSNCLLFGENCGADDDIFLNGTVLRKKVPSNDVIPRNRNTYTHKTRLVRSKTDPGLPLKTEPATPCREHSASQGDAPCTAYRTPSDYGKPKLCSGRTVGRDWGKSAPSDLNDISELREAYHEFIDPYNVGFQRRISFSPSYDVLPSEKTVEEQRIFKIRKSQAKWRRLSAGCRRHRSGERNRSSFLHLNSTVSSKNSFSLLRQSRSPSMMTESDDDEPTLISMFSASASLKSDCSMSFSPLLSAHNFRAIVVGGNYALCFDDGHPVVTAPKRSERRVVSSWKDGKGAMYLQLFFPKEKRYRILDLGTAWSYIVARPYGYLVSRNEIVANVSSICYFINVLPDESFPMHVPHCNFITANKILGDRTAPCGTNLGSIVTLHINDSMIEHDKDDIEGKIANAENSIYDMDVSDSDFAVPNGNDWNDIDVISEILKYLPHSGADVRSVSKLWAISYYRCIVEKVSNSNNILNKVQFDNIMKKYHNPRFISSGACKSVFRADYKANERTSQHALSVIDIEDLRKRDMDLCVKKEIEVSLMCSVLSQLQICPNLPQIYDVFRSYHPPPRRSWKPPLNYDKFGDYQYIRMEYCSGGDLEELLRREKTINTDTTLLIMFQMCFALYACEDLLSMRHYDVKLLNFLCSSSEMCFDHNAALAESISLNYVLGNFVFTIPVANGGKTIVKLVDFGTSCTGHQTLGDPITIHQFTTLENTPPEFLFLGSGARQSYSADIFALGLSWLHLLTGIAPYEELMKNVVCPPNLKKRLAELWLCSDPLNPYYLIGEVIRSVEPGDVYIEEYDETLFNTLYRYVVLFGLPIMEGGNSVTQRSIYNEDNPVWVVITEELNYSHGRRNQQVNSGYPRRRLCSMRSTATASIEQYEKDCALWSINVGTHPIIARLHHKLRDMGPAATKLLEKLTHFDPSRRCSLREVLMSDVFLPIRKDIYSGIRTGPHDKYFTYYSVM